MPTPGISPTDFATLQDEVKKLRDAVHARGPAGGFSSMWGAGASLGTGPDPATPPAGELTLESRLSVVEDSIREIKSQMEDDHIHLDCGVTFQSTIDVKAWLTKQRVSDLPHFFLDAISLLSLSDEIKLDEQDSARARETSAHIKDSSPKFTKYKGSGIVSLLNFFSVRKGTDDIRMVYDGTKSGLNTCLFTPWFALATVDQMLHSVDVGYWGADNDYREMFLNFWLHEC